MSEVDAPTRPGRLGMVRVARRVIVFIILGAIVNVLVAWGLAYRPDPLGPFTYYEPGEFYLHLENDGHTLVIFVRHNIGEETRSFDRNWMYELPYLGEREVRPQEIDEPAYRVPLPSWSESTTRGSWPSTMLIEQANGWPFLSLGFAYSSIPDLTQTTRKSKFNDSRGLILLPEWMRLTIRENGGGQPVPGALLMKSPPPIWPTRTRTELPWFPLWPGFLANTVIYAILLTVPFFALGATRRAIRRWRGRCPRCAYPIGASPVCTECGATLRRTAAAAAS